MSQTTNAPKRVLIFDSGVGGLSIYDALRAHRPDLEYVFLSDNAAYPYGTKDEQELIARVQQVIAAAINELKPDLVVIACNTASTVVLESLRKQHDVAFVGVVPAIKPAAQISKTKRIAVLATPATARRRYTHELIAQFASDCEVCTIGSSVLVDLAEKKLRGDTVDMDLLAHELVPINEFKNCDMLVLSCTHFPLLIKEIDQLVNANKHIKIIDSGEAIARRVSELIGTHNQQGSLQGQSWMTRDLEQNSQLKMALKDRHLPYQGVIKL